MILPGLGTENSYFPYYPDGGVRGEGFSTPHPLGACLEALPSRPLSLPQACMCMRYAKGRRARTCTHARAHAHMRAHLRPCACTNARASFENLRPDSSRKFPDVLKSGIKSQN